LSPMQTFPGKPRGLKVLTPWRASTILRDGLAAPSLCLLHHNNIGVSLFTLVSLFFAITVRTDRSAQRLLHFFPSLRSRYLLVSDDNS
jgi:hypothetical protein